MRKANTEGTELTGFESRYGERTGWRSRAANPCLVLCWCKVGAGRKLPHAPGDFALMLESTEQRNVGCVDRV